MSEAPPPRVPAITFSQACDRGKVREENQDHVHAASIPLGELFIVADGIGGYQGGATASRMVVEEFLAQLSAKPVNYPPEQALQEAAVHTNAAIYAAASTGDPAYHRMGSTVVLALIRGSEALIGHIGDSRAYLIRAVQMTRLTNDHSAVQALVNKNLLTEEEARRHPDSSVLTRSLGHRPEVEIEIDRIALQPGDALLLCSDGLWGYVAQGDISAVATDPNLTVETIADTMLHQALAAGGHDNIGIEFIRFNGAPPAQLAPLASGARSGPSSARRSYLQPMAFGLLLFAACGYLGFAALSHSWPFRVPPTVAQNSQPTAAASAAAQSADSNPKPSRQKSQNSSKKQIGKTQADTKQKSEKKILVVGDTSSQKNEKRPPKGAPHWKRVRITPESSPVCASHAEERPVVYAHTPQDLEDLLKQHPDLAKHVHGIDVLDMNATITEECGTYDVVLILPRRQSGASGGDSPIEGSPAAPAIAPSPQPKH